MFSLVFLAAFIMVTKLTCLRKFFALHILRNGTFLHSILKTYHFLIIQIDFAALHIRFLFSLIDLYICNIRYYCPRFFSKYKKAFTKMWKKTLNFITLQGLLVLPL